MLKGTLKTDVKLREFIENPTLKRQLKIEGLKQVASKFPLSSESSNLLSKYTFEVP
jgi:F0F1-type ATP synthase delta subunit